MIVVEIYINQQTKVETTMHKPNRSIRPPSLLVVRTLQHQSNLQSKSAHPKLACIMHMHNSSRYSDRLASGASLNEAVISNAVTPILGLVSGALAGSLETTLTYPLELAKTQAQLRFNRGWRHLNTTTFLQRKVAIEGLSSLYTGLGSAVSGAALKVGLRYLVFDGTVHALKDPNGQSSNVDYALAGIAAGVVESIAVATPSERIKTAMIDDANGAKNFRSTTDAAAQIFRSEGIQGIYRGLVSTTCKYAGTGAVKMGSYYFFAQQHAKLVGQPSGGKSVQDTFLLGAAAGTVTVCVTQPLDVVKTRRQSTWGETLVVAARNVLYQQGVSGFWSGSMFRLGRMSVSSGIVMSVHEKVIGLFRVDVR
jgi:solute carrier family 25 citrate transporter 1